MGRVTACRLLATVLCAAPRIAHAAPPATEPTTAPDLAAVGELFREGQTQFETSNFDAAIAVWTRAYGALPEGPAHAATRAMLIANIAQAHVAAHAVGGPIEHLRQADVLFEQYLAALDAADTETRATIDEERRKIAAAIAEHDAREAAKAPAVVVPPPPPRVEKARNRDEPRRDEVPTRRYSKWERRVAFGGAGVLVFGVALTGALGAFLWLRDEKEKDGRERARNPAAGGSELLRLRADSQRFNRLAISTGAAAAVFAIIGVGMIGGAEAHRVRRVGRATVRTAWGRGSFTASIGARF